MLGACAVFVLGVDMGGTATRAVLAHLPGSSQDSGAAGPDESGSTPTSGMPAPGVTASGGVGAGRSGPGSGACRVGSGRAGPGNPYAHPPERAVAELTGAVAAALGEVPGDRVSAAVVGMAGGAVLSEPRIEGLFTDAWRRLGLRCPLRVVGDTEVAFAAGTAQPAGTVLIAGTGATAASIVDHRMTRYVGGHGWLLGDDGAGFWLGRQAVRALLASLEGRSAPGRLTELVAEALAVPAEPRLGPVERVVTAVDHAHPVRLARLAPLVSTAAADGDPVAAGIVARAADHLVALATAARGDDAGSPVVLAGGVASGGPVGEAVRRRLEELWPVRVASDGAAGAAWLAALDTPGADPAALHRAIVG